jgi:glutamate/aspartate transport system substrate-binding protein
VEKILLLTAAIFRGDYPTTHTKERQKLAAFSNTLFVAGSRLMTRKDSGIKDFPDLSGKTVVTFARSTSEKLLRSMNSEHNFRINIVSTFDRGDTPVSVLQAGQADAYMMDDVLLYATIHETRRPDEWMVTGKAQSFEAYGCILPKDDPAFKKIVDQEIVRIMQSGEGELIYRKWLMSPIPPKSVNLNFPMSKEMINLFANPNDKPFD